LSGNFSNQTNLSFVENSANVLGDTLGAQHPTIFSRNGSTVFAKFFVMVADRFNATEENFARSAFDLGWEFVSQVESQTSSRSLDMFRQVGACFVALASGQGDSLVGRHFFEFGKCGKFSGARFLLKQKIC